MLEHILFRAILLWLEFNCIQNPLQKKALENKIEKERIKRKEETSFLGTRPSGPVEGSCLSLCLADSWALLHQSLPLDPTCQPPSSISRRALLRLQADGSRCKFQIIQDIA